jgi:hypothetical protein
MALPLALLAPLATQMAGSMFGGNKADVPSPALFTPDMQAAIMRGMQQYGNSQNLNYRTPTTVGQASATQTSTMSPAEVKKANYVDYLISQGLSPEEASRKAYQSVGQLRKDKGFKQAIKAGKYQDLRVRDGRIKASPKMLGGGVQISPEQQGLQNILRDFNASAFGAARGMPNAYAADEMRALGLRQGLTAPIVQRAFNANPNGLTPDTQNAINAIIGENQRGFGSMMKEGLQQATAELYDSGFGFGSSFAPAVIDQVMGKAASDYASKSSAQLAGIYSDMLTQGQARDTQALSNQLSTYGQLAQVAGLGNILGGVMSPTQVGGMTDAQAATLASQMQQGNIENRRADQQEINKWMGQGVNYLSDSGGMKGTLMGAAGVGLSALPSMFKSLGVRAS